MNKSITIMISAAFILSACSGGGSNGGGGADRNAPVVTEVTPIDPIIYNSTPDYTFSSSEEGVIILGGDCSSDTVDAIPGENTLGFNSLSAGTYNNCTVQVQDEAGNTSTALAVNNFTVSNCQTPQFPTDLKTDISQKLNEYPLIPGAVVAIYHPSLGHTISSYGLENVSENKAMPLGDTFDVGSVHKIFKWILLEKLYEQNRLDYNDAINDYVTLPVIAGGKILQLTNHSTGMVDIDVSVTGDIFDKYLQGGLPYTYTYAEMMDFLAAENDAGITNGFVDNFTRGEAYNYSSYGPVVAGEMAERITGIDSIDLMRELIIEELALSSTSFIGFDDTPDDRVQGYGNIDTGQADEALVFLPDDVLHAVSAASEGAVFSTACDMLNFSRSISDSALGYLSADTINSRIDSPNDLAGLIKIGRGVFNYNSFYEGNFWVHTGDGMHSHSSLIGYNPDKNIAVAIHANLKPLFIEDDYNFHYEILDVINSHF